MARYEDVINSFTNGGADRPEGAPRQPEVPGAPPSASRPSIPTSPELNMGVNGRPVGPGGPQMPMAPQADVPPPPSTATEGEVAGKESEKNVNAGPHVIMLNRMPRPGDLDMLPPNVTVRTPYGDLDEEGNIKTSPEYEQKHKEAIARAKQKFGLSPWNGMAGAPEMDMKLGSSFFNPFTNGFGRAE